MESAFEGIALATLTRDGSWTPEEVQALVAKTNQALKDPKIHGQYDL
jgi:hypothetical protein